MVPTGPQAQYQRNQLLGISLTSRLLHHRLSYPLYTPHTHHLLRQSISPHPQGINPYFSWPHTQHIIPSKLLFRRLIGQCPHGISPYLPGLHNAMHSAPNMLGYIHPKLQPYPNIPIDLLPFGSPTFYFNNIHMNSTPRTLNLSPLPIKCRHHTSPTILTLM